MKRLWVNIMISIFTIFACLFLLELILRTGIFDGENDPHPKWIPHKFKKIHEDINQKNWQVAKLNPYRFTDRIRNPQKDNGVIRIAILGDSFIWGYGIPYEQAWGHKLERLITKKYKDIEVLNWGFGGWSTMDEMSFLEKDGVNYNIDMLIVGFVNNDPDVGEIVFKEPKWHKFFLVNVVKIFFPNAISFIRSHINRLLFSYFKDYGYENWVTMLYSKENLVKYSELLQDFSQFCNAKNIKLLFVLTPSNHDDIYKEQFDKITPLLENAHIKYINLFPAVKRDLGHINQRRLWANPADGHPGTLMTDLFAKEVLNYLEKEGIFIPKENPYEEFIKRGKGIKGLKTVIAMALKETDQDMKKQAIITLDRINHPYTVDILIEALNNEDQKIRESAVDILGKIKVKDPRIINILLKALNDKNPRVRKMAILSLEKRDDLNGDIINAISRLAMNDNDRFVRRRAILALARLKNPQCIETLIHSLRDEFFFNRKASVIALGELKEVNAVEPLIALLKDDINGVRTEAAEALGKIKDPRAIEPLKWVALHDKDSLIRDIAADAIKNITGKDYARYRRKLLRMWESL
ncbi:MAG: HEAT repeat domain-containing protein [Candidatus Nitrosotenuis sp.]